MALPGGRVSRLSSLATCDATNDANLFITLERPLSFHGRKRNYAHFHVRSDAAPLEAPESTEFFCAPVMARVKM